MHKCHTVIFMYIRCIKDVLEVNVKWNWNVWDISILQRYYLFGLLYLFCGLGSIFHCLFLWGDTGYLGGMKITWVQTGKSSAFTNEKSVFSIRTISFFFLWCSQHLVQPPLTLFSVLSMILAWGNQLSLGNVVNAFGYLKVWKRWRATTLVIVILHKD